THSLYLALLAPNTHYYMPNSCRFNFTPHSRSNHYPPRSAHQTELHLRRPASIYHRKRKGCHARLHQAPHHIHTRPNIPSDTVRDPPPPSGQVPHARTKFQSTHAALICSSQ